MTRFIVKAKHFRTDRDIAIELDFQFLFYRIGHQQSIREVDEMAEYYGRILGWLES